MTVNWCQAAGLGSEQRVGAPTRQSMGVIVSTGNDGGCAENSSGRGADGTLDNIMYRIVYKVVIKMNDLILLSKMRQGIKWAEKR